MESLILYIDSHRANRHPLFAYLQEHLEDEVAWTIFATHYARAIIVAPSYFALLRERLSPREQEVLDFLIESIPSSLLLPEDFPPVSEWKSDVRNELPSLTEIEHFCYLHILGMRKLPLPECMGMLYSQLSAPSWRECVGLLLKPYEPRMDLIQLGAREAMNMRAGVWDAVLEAITGTEASHA